MALGYETEITALRKLIDKLENDIAYALDYVTSKRRIATSSRTALAQLEAAQRLADPVAAETAGNTTPPSIAAAAAYERYDHDKIRTSIASFVRTHGRASFHIGTLVKQLVDDGVVPWSKPLNQVRHYLYKKHLRPTGFTADRGANAMWHPPQPETVRSVKEQTNGLSGS